MSKLKQYRTLLIVIFMCNLITFVFYNVANSQRPFDYQVKARHILSFVKHIEWPKNAFKSNDSPYLIGVYGEDIFRNDLKNLIDIKNNKKEKIKNRILEYKYFTNKNDIESCHVLFISPNKNSEFEEVMALLKDSPTLFVGERNQIYFGQHINFKILDDYVRYDISLKALEHSKLKASADLLGFAHNTIE